MSDGLLKLIKDDMKFKYNITLITHQIWCWNFDSVK